MRGVQGRGRVVADVLRDEWDPIGGGRIPDLPRDEYDGYAPRVLQLLVAGATDLELARHLAALEVERMGLPPRPPGALLSVARKLRSLVDPDPT